MVVVQAAGLRVGSASHVWLYGCRSPGERLHNSSGRPEEFGTKPREHFVRPLRILVVDRARDRERPLQDY